MTPELPIIPPIRTDLIATENGSKIGDRTPSRRWYAWFDQIGRLVNGLVGNVNDLLLNAVRGAPDLLMRNVVPRVGEPGELVESNLRITDAGKAGVGTGAPTSALTVSENAAALPTPPAGTLVHAGAADGSSTGLTLDSFGAAPALWGRASAGTAALPTALASGAALLYLLGTGRGSTAYSTTPRAQVGMFTAQAWTDTAQGTIINFATTPNGSTTPAERMRIDQAGNIAIGTTTAVNRVTVSGGGVSVAGADVDPTVTGVTIGNQTTYQRIQSWGSTPLCLNPAGSKVGVGTTNPQALFSVGAGSFNTAAVYLPVQISTGAAGTDCWYGANKNGGFGLLVGYANAVSISGTVYTGGFIRQVTGDPIYFMVNNGPIALILQPAGGVAMPNLPAANPGAGTKQLWYDPADGNRVKFAP